MAAFHRSDRVAGWLTLAVRPRLMPWLFWKQENRPVVYFVVHNRSHVEIVRRSADFLARFPVEVEFSVPFGNYQARYAKKALNDCGLPWIPLKKMTERLRSHDAVVVMANLTPPAVRTALDRARQVGAVRISVMEGTRFTKKSTENIDHWLVWGPYSKRHFKGISTIIGSPAIEDMAAMAPASPASKTAVINYKFTWKEAELDTDHVWLNDAIRAVQTVGLEPIVSVHPQMQDKLPGYPVSGEPVEKLMSAARVLISRPSTVIPQAMRIGVQPFLMSVPEDDLREFAEPFGAYALSASQSELQSQLQTFIAGQSGYDHRQFLKFHVDERKFDPAYRRIARAILDLM